MCAIEIVRGRAAGVRLTFEDQGPGIADIERALTDHFTTGGGLGLGLGGAQRLSNEFTSIRRRAPARASPSRAGSRMIAVPSPKPARSPMRGGARSWSPAPRLRREPRRARRHRRDRACHQPRQIRRLAASCCSAPTTTGRHRRRDHRARQGAGHRRPGRAMRDGHSTAGAPGTGLGAVAAAVRGLRHRLLADPRHGRAGADRPGAGADATAPEPGAPSRCRCRANRSAATPLPAPGPGGLDALRGRRSRARSAGGAGSQARRSRLSSAEHLPPVEILKAVHAGLRHTRGAAVSVAPLYARKDVVHFAGVGNVAGPWSTAARRSARCRTPARSGSRCAASRTSPIRFRRAAASSCARTGLGTSWSLDGYPGLLSAHPTLVAGRALPRLHARSRDDAAVVVARDTAVVRVAPGHGARSSRGRRRRGPAARPAIAEQLGFALQDQTRIATALSEIARNAFATAAAAASSSAGGPAWRRRLPSSRQRQRRRASPTCRRSWTAATSRRTGSASASSARGA